VKRLFWFGYDFLSYVFFGIGLLLFPLRWLVKFISIRTQPTNLRLNSLWTGTPIITLAVKAKAEALLGVNAKSLVYDTYFITSDFDYNLSGWTTIPLVGKLTSLFVFLWVCLWADRIHMYMDRGVLLGSKPLQSSFKELLVYKKLGISVFFWTYGADVRSRQTTEKLGHPNCCTECPAIGKACICDEYSRKIRINKLTHYARCVFSMGDMMEYTVGSRNDLFFWPLDLYGAKSAKYKAIYPTSYGNGQACDVLYPQATRISAEP